VNNQLDAYRMIPPSRRLFAGFILALANFIVVLDVTIANVSVPHIAGNLGISPTQGTWVITSYAVAEAITVPLAGWLSQRFGTVRLMIASLSGFGFFSLMCGLSPTLGMLVVCRVGQGICGGPIMPMSQTLMLRVFPPEARAKAMGLWAMTTLLGPASGPIIGGLISDSWSWHWIFFINIPVVIFAVTAAISLLRPIETETRKVPIDRVGLALLIFWIGCLQLMLDLGRERDWFGDPMIVALAICAGLGFAMFVIWELTDEHPIVDLRIFRHRSFTFGVLTLALCFGSYFASIVVIPQWLQVSMGYSATRAGFTVALTAIAALTTSQLAAKLAMKSDARLLVSLAVAWLGVNALWRSHWVSEADFWTFASPQLVQGFAMSFFVVPLTTITLTSLPPSQTASAAGLQNFLRTISIGIATSLALTYWENSQRVARTELAGSLQADDVNRMLSSSGFSAEQGRQIISNLVDREATTLAINHTFLVTAAIFFFAAAIVWLAPRPKAVADGAPGGH